MAAACLGVAAYAFQAGAAGHSRRSHYSTASLLKKTRPIQTTIPAVEAGLVPWSLPHPLARASAVALSANRILLGGGVGPTGSSSSATWLINPLAGTYASGPSLPAGAHDQASAAIGETAFFFGGGSTGVSDSAEEILPQLPTTGRVVGQLPRPRADTSAVTLGGTIYIVGGYDGTQADPSVLATTNGRSFATVGNLPRPVRYAAVAALGDRIYAFGGETVSGDPTNLIQEIDPFSHRGAVIGHLPLQLYGASAFTLGGHIYVAGGMAGPRRHQVTANAIWAFDPANPKMLLAGHLMVPVAFSASAVAGGRGWLLGGEGPSASPTSNVEVIYPNTGFGWAGKPGAGSPYYGYRLLIADRGNDRLLLLSDTGKIIWQYPGPGMPPPPTGFYFPDDAFFVDNGHEIISNQEENETILIIDYPSGQVVWTYGHPRVAGSAPGYLNNPDDAYLLKNGDISVADPMNCRVLIIDPRTKQVIHQIGTTGVCYHSPPTELGSPNGDTPLIDGNLLISEINGSWIDEYTLTGHLVWTVQLPIVGYVSDPQQIGPDRYLVADYSYPGAFVEFNRAGQILYRYAPTKGPGELNHPSLVEMLPSGVLMANDDHNDRMVAVDPATNAVVWQYGVTGVPGSAPGYLDKPDGFDIVSPSGLTPTHPATG